MLLSAPIFCLPSSSWSFTQVWKQNHSCVSYILGEIFKTFRLPLPGSTVEIHLLLMAFTTGCFKGIANHIRLTVSTGPIYSHSLSYGKEWRRNADSHFSKKIYWQCLNSFFFFNTKRKEPWQLSWVLITLKQSIKFEEEMHNKCLFTL